MTKFYHETKYKSFFRQFNEFMFKITIKYETFTFLLCVGYERPPTLSFFVFPKSFSSILMQNIGNFCSLRLVIHNEFIWRLLCCNYLLFLTLETNFDCILCRTYHKLLCHLKIMQKILEGQNIHIEFTPSILQYVIQWNFNQNHNP